MPTPRGTGISVLFALAGVCISSSGLVGIVMFVVARRTREIAIRRAIGAQPGHIIDVVIREAAAALATADPYWPRLWRCRCWSRWPPGFRLGAPC